MTISPRELDARDDVESLAGKLIAGDAMVIWRHDFDWDEKPALLLLLTAGEDGPRILGISSWMGMSERQARVRMDVSLDEICRPMIPDVSSSGMTAHPVHHTDRIGQAFERSIPGAAGLRLHWNEGTAGHEGTYVGYFGRAVIAGQKMIVAGHATQKRDLESKRVDDPEAGVGFMVPLNEFKQMMTALVMGDEPASAPTP